MLLALLPTLVGSAAAQTPTATAALTVEVFVREGCPHCVKAEAFLAALARERPGLQVVVRDVIQEPAALQRLQALAHQHGAAAVRVPAFAIGNQLIFGFSEEVTPALIRQALQQGLPQAQPGAAGDATPAGKPSSGAQRVAPERFAITLLDHTVTLDDVGLPLFTLTMGLLDGFNPCSMWVLLLMISLLATLRDRRRMLAVAGTFVVVQGLAYYAFMAAWLNLFLLIGLSRASQVAIAAIAFVAGALNLKDAVRPGVGPSLAIADSAKPGIYARLRALLQVRSLPAALAGAVVLGLLVQVVELLCTSGFPALFTRILTLRQLDAASYYGYLLLYNLAYMLDDMVVIAIGVATLSQHRLQDKEGRRLKLLSGLVMVGLGVYLIVTG